MEQIDLNRTRIIFIHRDGRDVAISLQKRGYSWHKAVKRWVQDNNAILPHLDRNELLTLSFEDLANSEKVVHTLRKIKNHLRLEEISDVDLSISLLPGKRIDARKQIAASYYNDREKAKYLGESLVNLMASMSDYRSDPQKSRNAVDIALQMSEENARRFQHQQFRSWQMSQAWHEHFPTNRNWSTSQKEYFWRYENVSFLMDLFNYSASD